MKVLSLENCARSYFGYLGLFSAKKGISRKLMLNHQPKEKLNSCSSAHESLRNKQHRCLQFVTICKETTVSWKEVSTLLIETVIFLLPYMCSKVYKVHSVEMKCLLEDKEHLRWGRPELFGKNALLAAHEKGKRDWIQPGMVNTCLWGPFCYWVFQKRFHWNSPKFIYGVLPAWLQSRTTFVTQVHTHHVQWVGL